MHGLRDMIYVNLNMVRAGVVGHPSEWPFSGYNVLQARRERYAIIDYEGLGGLLDFRGMDDLADAYRGLVNVLNSFPLDRGRVRACPVQTRNGAPSSIRGWG